MSAPKRNVAYIKPQQPSFLKAFKEKVGYKEPDTIDAKRAKVTPSGEGGGRDEGVASDEEREDELPTVVVLQKGDVGDEEYQKFREALKEKEKEEPPTRDDKSSDTGDGIPTVPLISEQDTAKKDKKESGKIVFKRPVKRRRSSEGVLDASTKKTSERGEGRDRGQKIRSPRTRKGSSSAVKNSSLLSFGDEDEDSI